MKKYNIGEWSEIYTFLKLLLDGIFYVNDSELTNIIDTYEILEVYKNSFDQNEEKRFLPMEMDKKVLDFVIKETLRYLKNNSRTFSIPILEKTALDFDFSLDKGKSKTKNDIDVKINDKYRNTFPRLGYSIKSDIGSKPTLINSSGQTNFLYRIDNFNEKNISLINNIKTKYKLKDRYNKIVELGGKIVPIGSTSEIFSFNLRKIDGDIENLVAIMLLLSYQNDDKDIPNLLDSIIKINPLNISQTNMLRNFYASKFVNFFNAMAFEIFPGEIFREKQYTAGGIIYVQNDGTLKLLDKIYYHKEVDKFLLKRLKFDSPSSSRYHMLELYKNEEDNNIYFTLNLQIRFK